GTPAHGMTSNTIHPSIKFDPIEESNSMFYIPISYDLEKIMKLMAELIRSEKYIKRKTESLRLYKNN
ncbi:MAG: hypothetical protein ACTSXF_14665, partial [Promethearchaeota archaeon]